VTKEDLSLKQDNIIIEYTPQDREFVEETFDNLSEAVWFLTDYFELDDTFPTIRTILTPNRGEFDRCVKEILKIDIEVPSHPCRIAMPQRTDLVILSPLAYERGINHYSSDSYRRLLFHEAVHIFEEYLSPNIDMVTRWWSEGLAMSLSGHWKDEKTEVLERIGTGTIPSIKEMEGGSAFADNAVSLCYLWGWTMVKYVECAYGKGMIRRIVKECDDGDIFKMVGEKAQSLEKKWQGWLLSEVPVS
jgi:hypothetical protein